MKWRPKCYQMVPDQLENGAQNAIKWRWVSYKMVANVVLASLSEEYLYLRFLWRKFAFFLFLSLSVIFTSPTQPCCKCRNLSVGVGLMVKCAINHERYAHEEQRPDIWPELRSRRFLSESDVFFRLRMPTWVIFYIKLVNWEFLLKWYNFIWNFCWITYLLLCTTISIDWPDKFQSLYVKESGSEIEISTDRTGPDQDWIGLQFFESWWIRTGSDWEMFCFLMWLFWTYQKF